MFLMNTRVSALLNFKNSMVFDKLYIKKKRRVNISHPLPAILDQVLAGTIILCDEFHQQ